ncbi:hypothetical protein ACGF12_18535 [Kitasatospora sp. NPDC048296]|uniref:hypothetical protein n=1 Tax=Kitasatospora sp. NPDC048296 TaxID=3364048 RepID=UPI00371878F9
MKTRSPWAENASVICLARPGGIRWAHVAPVGFSQVGQQPAGRCTTLARHRQISIGMVLDLSPLAAWPDGAQDEPGFKELVSTAYKLWWETWKLDVRFLISFRPQGGARDFDHLINLLRTSHQHAGTGKQDEQAKQWARNVCGGRDPATSDDWMACGTALMETFNTAIDVLCQTITQHQNRGFRTAWQNKVAVSEEAVVVRVAADLGMRLNEGLQGYHVSQVKRRWASYRLRRDETADDTLAAFAEQSLISRAEALPCSYLDVLSELKVLGTPKAVPALRLAHAGPSVSLG